jgi:hypothetical protein
LESGGGAVERDARGSFPTRLADHFVIQGLPHELVHAAAAPHWPPLELDEPLVASSTTAAGDAVQEASSASAGSAAAAAVAAFAARFRPVSLDFFPDVSPTRNKASGSMKGGKTSKGSKSEPSGLGLIILQNGLSLSSFSLLRFLNSFTVLKSNFDLSLPSIFDFSF